MSAPPAAPRQRNGQGACPGPHLEHVILGGQPRGVSDAIAYLWIDEEVLAKRMLRFDAMLPKQPR